MQNTDAMLPLAFSVQSNKGVFALLLGSGISRESGIPTGWEIVLDLVRQVAALQEEDCGTEPAQWYQQAYGEEPRYDKLLEMTAKSPAERSQKIRPYIEPTDEEREEGKKTPTKAHRAIAALVAKDYIRVIVTTNFDRLLETALAEVGVTPTVISKPEDLEHSVPLTHSACTIIKIHGDYIETSIRNTPDELATYPDKMNTLLDRVFDEYGLIICGWSAEWDVALYDAVNRSSSRHYSAYWSDMKGVTSQAAEIIDKRGAYRISGMDADAFFTKLEEKVTALEDIEKVQELTVPVAIATVKRYIVDDVHRIRLHDLVMDETENALTAIRAQQWVSRVVDEDLLSRLRECQHIIDALQAIIITGCYFGKGKFDDLWVRSLTRIASLLKEVHDAHRFDKIVQYPACQLLYAAGIASLAGGNTMTLARMLHNVTAKVGNNSIPVWKYIFPTSILNETEMPESLGYRPSARASRFLYTSLRDPLRSCLPDDDAYAHCFSLFEFWFGLAVADISDSQTPEGLWGPRGLFASYLHRSEHSLPGAEILAEAQQASEAWEPLQVGLFRGSLTRFEEVYEGYRTFLQKAPE